MDVATVIRTPDDVPPDGTIPLESDLPEDRPDALPVLEAIEAEALEAVRLVTRNAAEADLQLQQGGGWARVLRNTVVAFAQQAGGRMAAALSYYSILAGGPVLLLTLLLGSALFGEDAARQAVSMLLQRFLPAGVGDLSAIAADVVQTSRPVAGLAVLTGVGAMVAFTRALAFSLNVTLNTEGIEPFRRTFLVGPVLLAAVVGLLWGAWAFELLIDVIQLATGSATSTTARWLLGGLAPLLMATLYFAVILIVVPRARLSRREVLVPALFGALLWEAARHAFGWSIAGESVYARVFGPLGGVVALLAWVYLSSAILILTGQFAWAHAMELRGRGRLAGAAPRRAGLRGWVRPFGGDNAVNEDSGC